MKKYFANQEDNFQSQNNQDEFLNERKRSIIGGIDKLMAVSLFMMFLGIPLFFTGLTFQGIVFEKQIFFYFWALLALISWAAKGVILGEMKIRRTPLDIPIIVFWSIYVLATIFSVDKWHSFWGFFGDPSRGLMGVTALVIIYYLILSNFTKKRMQWMIGGLVSSSVLISVWSLLLFMGIDFIPDNAKAFIPFNLIGTSVGLKLFIGAMLPLIILIIFKMKTEGNIIKKFLFYGLLLFIPINLFLTSVLYEKTSALVILVGIGFLLLYILSHVVRPKVKLIWIPMAVFVLAMIVLMVGQNNFSRIDIPLEVSPNAKVSWEVTKGVLKEKAILGSGPATYGYDFSAFKPQEFNNNTFFELRFYQATGVFFEAIATIGILGTLAFLVLTIVFVNISIYLVSKDKDKNKIYSLSLLSAILILMAGSFLMRVEGTILLIGGLLGALAMATMLWESGVKEKSINLSLKASPKFALTLAFLFIIISSGVAALFVYIGKAYVADIYAGNGLRSFDVSEKSVTNIMKAINLNNREGRYYSRASQEFMAIANKEALKSADEQNIDLIKDNINKSLSYGKASVEYMPNDALNISVLAQIYENAGLFVADTLELSMKTYEDILKIEPHNPIAYLKVGQIKITTASFEEDESKRTEIIKKAKESLLTALEKKANLDIAYYYLSIAENALGEKSEAIISASNAVQLNPNNITYLFNLGRLYQDRNEGEDSKNAQKIFEYILTINADDVNTNLASGLLYERAGEKNKAIKRYEKVSALILGDSENEKSTKEQLKKMIENVKTGISNDRSVQEQVETPKEDEQLQIDLNQEEKPAEEIQEPIEAPTEE